MNTSTHPRDALQEFLDGRLEEPARSALADHLGTCAACRAELAALRRVRQVVAGSAAEAAPPGLAGRIGAALDAEDEDARSGGTPPLWWPVAAAAILVLALLALPLARRGPANTVLEAAGAIRQTTVGTLTETRASPEALESWFEEQGLPFPARVFDFGGMAFDLAGGRMHAVTGEPAALYAYRGPDGARVPDLSNTRRGAGALRRSWEVVL